MSFAGKVVIVTGASSGIGAATAILFANEAANVVMVGRNQAKLKVVADKVKNTEKNHLVIIADVSKEDDVKRIIKETIGKFGKLDFLVNNAGFSTEGTILGGTFLKSYDAIMSVNVRAVANLTMLAAPHIIATKGNIINISSVAALTVPFRSDFLAYHISKAALDSFTKGVAAELAPSGVRVNSVNPGPVQTDFLDNAGVDGTWDDFKGLTALNRYSKPEEIGNLVMYLASEKAVGITGSIFVADNGYLIKK